MEIAYIYDAVYPWVKGGAEKRIYELSRRLAARGHTVHCYGMKWWPGEDDLFKGGVHLHGIGKPRPLYINGRRSVSEAAYFAARLLARAAEEEVVDCQNFPYLSCFSAKLSNLWKRKERQKLFITWHEVWGDYWYDYLGKKGIIGKVTEQATARLTDRNIGVSKMTARDLDGLGARGVNVVPNGIDWQEIETIDPSKRESDIVYVGRLAAHKNIDLLLQAVSIAKSKAPDLRVAIIGDGPEMKKLRSLVKEMNLEKNVEFLGFLESYSDALALMKSSRAFASPSTREGFGMAALEANACGLPVVTINHRMNAVTDLVTEETGMVCQPTAEDLAEGLILALQKGNAMREPCQRLAKGYDWERICDRLEKIYEKG